MSGAEGAGDRQRGLSAVLGNKSHVFVLIDAVGDVRWASPSFRPVLGHDPEAVAGRNVVELLHPDDVGFYLGALEAFLAPDVASQLSDEDAGLSADIRVRHADGRWRTLEVVSTIFLDEDEVESVLLVGHDVSERRGLDSSLPAMAGDATRADAVEAVLRYVDHHLLDTASALWIPEDDGATWITASSPPALQVDQSLWRRLVAEGSSIVVEDLQRTDQLDADLVARAVALGFCSVWAFSVPSVDLARQVDGRAPDVGGTPAACLVVWSRRHREPFITHRYALQSVDTYLSLALQRREHDLELRRAAHVDPLTGVLSRAGLEHVVAEEERQRSPRTVLLIDLDGFKDVNDRLGHQAGDEALALLAGRIAAQVRDGDLVGRLGGDEFVVGLRDGGPADAAEVAERLVAAISLPFVVAGEQAAVTASIGIALHDPGSDLDQVLARADRAMYEAKREPGGRWVLDETVGAGPQP